MQKRSLTAVLMAMCIGLFLLNSCQKDGFDSGYPEDNSSHINFSEKVTSSTLTGIVTDKNGAPLSGVMVSAGNKTATTNSYGMYVIKNAEVVKNAGVIKAEMPGYFTGIRTYKAEAGKTNFSRIQLLEKTLSGSINAASGGEVTANDGFVINLPAEAVVTSSGAAYTGEVKVFAHFIDVDMPQYGEQMPGDLRGLDGSNTKLLTSYGMAAVELEDASGGKLQLAAGKKSTLSFPSPTTLSNQPATIPMWWFDEEKGFWIKDGSSNKVGNNYVAEVSHFTFWNVDMEFDNPVPLSFSLLYSDGTAATNAYITISSPNGYGAIYASSDSLGYVSGYIPANTSLTINVHTYNYDCAIPLLTYNFTSGNSATNLGPLVITILPAHAYSLSGIVYDCTAMPMQNGYIITSVEGYQNIYTVTNGNFNINFQSCQDLDHITLIAFTDLNQLLSGASVTINPNIDTANISINMCQQTLEQFFTFTMDSSVYNYVAPPDSTRYLSVLDVTAITAFTPNDSINVYNELIFSEPILDTGIHYTNRTVFQNTPYTTPLAVHITEVGPVGGFVAGNFSGTQVKTYYPTDSIFVSGSFRVRKLN